jgi:hypothetical protein
MRGNRMLLIVAVVLIILAVGGAAIFLLAGGDGDEEDLEPIETPVITNTTQIVVSGQNIPRGMQVFSERNAVVLKDWPNDYLPFEYYTSLAEVDGKYASMDIPRGMPVLPDMLAESGDLPALFEPGRVAYAIPMDTQGAVAWAIQTGDHVDVLAAIKLMAVDEEFQSPLPNQFFGLGVEEQYTPLGGVYGRFETLPNGQPALVYPSGDQISHMIVQLTVQDAIIWHIGIWEQATEGLIEPEQTQPAILGGEEGGDEGGGGGAAGLLGGGQAAAQPAPLGLERSDIEPVTLLVTRQDAVVLKYLMEMGADLDFVLRPAGETATAITQPVWLLYILDKYQIPNTMPSLPVAPTPFREPLGVPTATPAVAVEE